MFLFVGTSLPDMTKSRLSITYHISMALRAKHRFRLGWGGGGWGGVGVGGTDAPNRLFMNGVLLSVSIFLKISPRQIYSVEGLPDQNIAPQQLATCLFLFLHFDLK